MEIRYEHKGSQGGEAPEDMTMEPRWISNDTSFSA